ncbi:hypothetical protein SAMN05428988_2760 [Chitinophaga sp. YR573]|uniref:hypothetical protein n=1 Tax=Chitinophaga sp. YR573 TaxID=1881040 RepID=UPI0008B9E941|nr:hypothetical protein [Chitinophaga sp. YR573]SEW17703.1 hypothetical protein SAMN05428988_2760 [Chitinophaga sp. YR573]
MRFISLYALASIILFISACKKDDPSPEQPASIDYTTVSFTYDKFGSTELYYMLSSVNPGAKISTGKSSSSFSYELTGSNGLKRASDTLIKGSGTLDGAGNTTLPLWGLWNYKDGEITLKVHFTATDSTIQVKTQKIEYQIRNYRDFMYMSPFGTADTSDHFVQVNDIAFPDTVFTKAPWNSYLLGSYDGKGFKITNLTIKSPGATSNEIARIALFAGADSGSVLKNIRLELSDAGITSTGQVECGGLVAFASGCTISQCSVKGNILIPKDVSSFIGGISGHNNKVTMTGCSFRGRITGSNVGGLMGSMGTSSVINMCYAYFSFDSYAVGGIGSVYSPSSVLSISNSYVVAHDYTSPTFVAIGPVQYAMTSTTVTNCFANAGTAQTGVTIFASTTDINTNLSTFTIANWPAEATAPADKKPYKYDTDPTAPMKLWWE